jgi:hypothetical protein
VLVEARGLVVRRMNDHGANPDQFRSADRPPERVKQWRAAASRATRQIGIGNCFDVPARTLLVAWFRST